ncbi:hypothetical protein [Paenibacillus sp. QZ-Y1]|uniref:hypothetical protein n=1 Tax=Paenibacillus sp. QZ-Y1 TaxID=3414511 RepID=UPI003F78D45C
MTNGERESFKLARRAAILQQEHINTITRTRNMINNPSISRMIEQINLSSKAISQYSQAWEVSQGVVNAAHQAGLAWNDSLSEIAKMVSSPSFIGITNELKNLSSASIKAMEGIYNSPSYRAMIESMDVSTIQSIVDTLPEDIASNINDLEQELQNDPDTKSKFEPYINSMENVISAKAGTHIDLSKSKLSVASLEILLHLIFFFFNAIASPYLEYLLIPNPVVDLVEISQHDLEETKRHNLLIEQNQQNEIELKQQQIKIDQEQVEVNKEILSELKKTNEQKKDSD